MDLQYLLLLQHLREDILGGAFNDLALQISDLHITPPTVTSCGVCAPMKLREKMVSAAQNSKNMASGRHFL